MSVSKLWKLSKPVAVIVIVVATSVLFVWYFQNHPEYITRLRHTSPWVILQLVTVNTLLIGAIATINHVSALACRKQLKVRESVLLTIYSSLANFFGPLQSGPGVRAAYLKTKYGVKLRDYTFVVLISYAIFALTSALFLVVGVLVWWQTVLVIIATAGVCSLVLWWFQRQKNSQGLLARLDFSPRIMGILIIATVLQVLMTAVRYGIELHAVGAHARLGQIISYAGAANFSLFVSLTPDGIGIREAFLLFAQRLHGISTDQIMSASLLDRASYLVFLGVLGVVALALHAKKSFTVSHTPTLD